MPQDVKTETPGTPNDRLGHLTGICNFEAMSNGQGPAAEAVTHRIGTPHATD